MIDSECPGTALETIAHNPCVDIFGKDYRWIFQRTDDANNKFVNGTNGIEEATSWSALPDATGGTKTVITPVLEEVTFNEPDDLDDSENPDGAPFAVGEGAQLVTAVIRNPSPAQYAALKAVDREAALSFYRVDNNGNFGARLIGSDHAGIKISEGTFRIKSPFRDGTRNGVPMKLRIQMYLPSGWFETFAVVAPEAGFDPKAIAPS